MILEKLKKHISNIEDYKLILIKIDSFLKEKSLVLSKETEETFWNHIGSLLERMKNNEQNTLEIPTNHGIDEESIHLTDELINTAIRPELDIPVTDFEKFLVALYFQNMEKKKGGGS